MFVITRTLFNLPLIRTLSTLSLFLVCFLLCDADMMCYSSVSNDVIVNICVNFESILSQGCSTQAAYLW